MKPFRHASILKVRSLDKLRGRTRRRRLAFESLEHRTLLAATSSGLGVGVNLSQTNYYNDEYMWANAMEQANDSWWLGQESAGGSSYAFVQNPPPGIAMPAMDTNGYPIGLGGLAAQGYSLATFVFTNIGVPFPTGTYTLTFDGSGTVAICQANQPVQSFTQTSSVGSPFDVSILPTGSGITVAITSSDPSNYVKNIRLVLPGLQQTYQSNPFNPQFLNALQPFSTIRFIGAMLPDFSSATTSDGQSGPLTWAERTPPTYFTQATPAGMSVEYMVQLCNILHENMWVTMPVNGTSDYVTNFAQYVEQNLNPGLQVYVEYGDEVWNSAFPYEYNYVNNYSIANNEPFEYATADLTAACWNNWEQVFAGQTNRIVRVAATQFTYPARLGQELTRLVATASPTDPNHGFDVVSGGSYFSSANTSSYNASTTVGQIESDMMAQLTGPWKVTLQYFMATVASFEAQLGRPIPVDMYEGGEGFAYVGGSSWYNAYLAVDTDPGNYAIITTFLDDLTNAGVQGMVYTSLASQATQYGEWGAMEYVGQPSSQTPKYNALVAFTSLGTSAPPASVPAGTAFQFTVTAYEPNGSTVDTNYTGTVKFASSDPLADLPSNYTFTPGDDGVHTFTVTLKTAGTQSITATSSTDGAVGLLQGIVVQAGTLHSLVITGIPSNVYAGRADSFEVSACDAFGNVVTGYTGTVTFTSSDPLAGLPSNYTFTPAAASVQTFAVQFQSDGAKTITVTDTTTPTLTGSASTTVVPHSPASWDINTQGNWMGTYGSQGYDLFSGPSSLPSYASVTSADGYPYVWSSGAPGPRALQEPGGTGRLAACIYSSRFTVDVNLTDGNTHSLALYFLDWDNRGRSEQVQLANAATGAILDSETMSSFYGGVYLDWNISGNVRITITQLAGANAVLSGLFVGLPSTASSARLIKTDTATQGNWIGTYGTQGNDLFGVGSSLASYATVTNTGAYLYTWATGTTDPRAPQQLGGTSRIAACEYGQSFTVDVNVTDGENHVLALYFLDWDNQGRAEQVQLTNATTGAVLDTETVLSFSQGVYLDWNISGNVQITITRLAGPNAVLSGLFLSPPSASASLVGTDTTTQGNWIGTYGKSGYDLLDVGSSLPSYASVVNQNGYLYAWTTNTTDPRALELPGGTGRAAATAFQLNSFTIDLNLTDGNTHSLALYFLDWDNQGRSEQVQITNAATGAVLDTETISSFSQGVYLKWNVSGNVLITITRLAGPNAVLSGLFIS
jgi:hypothetical protein